MSLYMQSLKGMSNTLLKQPEVLSPGSSLMGYHKYRYWDQVDVVCTISQLMNCVADINCCIWVMLNSVFSNGKQDNIVRHIKDVRGLFGWYHYTVECKCAYILNQENTELIIYCKNIRWRNFGNRALGTCENSLRITVSEKCTRIFLYFSDHSQSSKILNSNLNHS